MTAAHLTNILLILNIVVLSYQFNPLHEIAALLRGVQLLLKPEANGPSSPVRSAISKVEDRTAHTAGDPICRQCASQEPGSHVPEECTCSLSVALSQRAAGANARLIAAAPDMLALIKECRKQINSIIEDGIQTDWSMWRDDIDALISKADSEEATVHFSRRLFSHD